MEKGTSMNYLTSVRDSFSGSWPKALRNIIILFSLSLGVGSIFSYSQGVQPGMNAIIGAVIGAFCIGILSIYLRRRYPSGEDT